MLELIGKYSTVNIRNIFWKGCRVLNIKRITASTLLCFLVFFTIGETTSLAKSVTLTPGVSWNSSQGTVNKKNQFVNTLIVNLNDPYTTVNFGTNTLLEKRSALTTLARQNTYNQHHVVGAVNASIFHMQSGEPAYLLAKDNKIINLGNGGEARTGFMNVPAAFGVTKNNIAKIDRYNVDISVTHNNKSIKMLSYNQVRYENDSVLYTPSFRWNSTRTNGFGYEVTISGLPKSIDKDLSFGESVTGKVTSIRPYGKNSSPIPKDGFVLSATGTQIEALKKMALGDEVSINLNIDQKWRDASFMLASGPLLVQNGKVNMTIDYNTGKAVQRTSRTAVAVDRTGKKVFMVTVDSKRKGKSEGMSMKEFASHLVQLGAYQAINLDGGGSTTMAARIPGNRYASLVNLPSEGNQRAVSAILQAVSTAPYGDPKTMIVAQQSKSNLLVGGTNTYSVTAARDAYNNVLEPNKLPIKYSVTGSIGRMDKSKFVAEKPGNGHIVIQSGAGVTKVPVTVEDRPTKLKSNNSNVYVGKGKTDKISITAFGKNGNTLLYDKTQVKYSVKGNIGNIKSDGTFIAGQTEGMGKIIAELSGEKIEIPVTVSSKPLVVSSLDSVKQWKPASIKSSTALLENKSKLKKGGTGYLGIKYNFTKYKNGTSASYMKPASKLTVPYSPKSLSVWAWADAKNHWLRGSIKDSSGKVYTINFTQPGQLNWKGKWKLLTANIPTNIKYPISVESIYVAETIAKNKTAGTIYLDELMANY